VLLKKFSELLSVPARSLQSGDPLEKLGESDFTEGFCPYVMRLLYSVECSGMGWAQFGIGLFNRLTAYGTSQGDAYASMAFAIFSCFCLSDL
jgi:hypothetical protein